MANDLASSHANKASEALGLGDHKKAAHHLGHAMRALRKPKGPAGSPGGVTTPMTADERAASGPATQKAGDSGQATHESSGKTSEPAPKGRFFGQFGPSKATSPKEHPNTTAPKSSKLAGLLKSIKPK